MGYVNFKEELSVGNTQLEKRKKNNQEICKYILKHTESLEEYNTESKYCFGEFKDKLIGKKGVFDEENFKIIENEDIVCSKFINCSFLNVKFKDCRFVGCVFDECNFSAGGVVFENCILIKEDSEKTPSLNKKDNLSCSFYNCNIYAKFLDSDISFTIFENSKFKNTSFEQSIMKSVIINNCELHTITFEDCDFCGGKIIKTYIKDLDFNDKYKTKFDEKTFFDKIKPRECTKQEYEGIYMTYETIADKFKENTLNNNFGEYYFLGKCTERKSLSFCSKLTSYIYYITCGYGERPEFALYTGLGIILIFSFIYLFTGVKLEGEDIKYTIINIGGISFTKFLKDINETLNLSIGMFAGVGANNGQPSEISYMVSNIEMIIGVIMMGIGIGTLTRKIVR